MRKALSPAVVPVLAVLSILALNSPHAFADLGGADINEQGGKNATGTSYSAKCGK
jgi:hypothetical protein